eukprot:CAMPEP_0181220606 /NCGR_PEP_ID=MMETSP1096-20121128/28931_1 /TAXON_ID=156174 ORGANISM="Chrysochromulina ericina, Strain CCMP281" /NCGR_SAMPLE_ID=MMETSP1096 /ASSEMBLY_ACC=CAM_ASM_000453 /LENGTH=77 /DNA_ID=CAMNT_0023313129 /DNA_START=11 /DNA_END=244 /DNA_ORIENTATION=+
MPRPKRRDRPKCVILQIPTYIEHTARLQASSINDQDCKNPRVPLGASPMRHDPTDADNSLHRSRGISGRRARTAGCA